MLEVLFPWILLNRNFLKENCQYPHAGRESFGAKIFSKLLLGQCRVSNRLSLFLCRHWKHWTDVAVWAAISFQQRNQPWNENIDHTDLFG
jgi:hypothetical protein